VTSGGQKLFCHPTTTAIQKNKERPTAYAEESEVTENKNKSVVFLAGAARSHTPTSEMYLHSGGIDYIWETYQ